MAVVVQNVHKKLCATSMRDRAGVVHRGVDAECSHDHDINFSWDRLVALPCYIERASTYCDCSRSPALP